MTTTTERTDARLIAENNILVAPASSETEVLRRDFCGTVVTADDLASGLVDLSHKTVYLCGDLSRLDGSALRGAERVFVVKELAHGFHQSEHGTTGEVVSQGRAPLRVHGVGVYYRQFFDPNVDFFHRICAEHTFQSLTESTKPAKAHRTGIYLTPVAEDAEGLHFRLLRCSTNLAGPTENFRATDRLIVDALNCEAGVRFQDHAPLNHVLAQVYHNTPAAAELKEAKARIAAHADKTKDMPANGIMAFCTFYDRLDRLRPLADDPFDYGTHGVSGLTRLLFRLKEPVAARPDCPLPRQFSLTLYPHSVFFMPLSTNRLYTHEIRSSMLGADVLPTRLGYVVRCSSAEAVHTDGQTFLKRDGRRVPLGPPTPEGMAALRKLYAEENRSEAFIDYGDGFLFSMNGGDYLAPRT